MDYNWSLRDGKLLDCDKPPGDIKGLTRITKDYQNITWDYQGLPTIAQDYQGINR